jgi:hypothetical protein
MDFLTFSGHLSRCGAKKIYKSQPCVGLSLADAISFFVGHFSPAGRKMTHKELNIFGERKS